MAILLWASAVFALEGKKFIDIYRLKTTVQLLKSEWEKAKLQSMLYRADIELEILENKKGLQLRKKCDDPAFSRIKMISLPGVTEMRYQGKKRKQMTFAKFSSGYCINSEKIELRNGEIKEEITCNFLQKPLQTAEKSH